MKLADLPSVKDHVSAQEWRTGVDLAACDWLVAEYGWDDLIFTHSRFTYHGYEGAALNDDEKPRLIRDLGDKKFSDVTQPWVAQTGQNDSRRVFDEVFLKYPA